MSASPRLIYGTAWKQDRTTELVVKAVLGGFRSIDTACQPKHYREDAVGEALSTLQDKHGIKREDLFIQTKYTPIGGQDQAKPIPYNPSDTVTAQIHSSIQKSLSNLRTTYIDSYLLHSPLKTTALTVEAWRALIRLQDEGKVRRIGVSNAYDVRTLQILARERQVQVVQNRWYEGNEWDREVYNYCRENDIQYQSFWTLSGSPSLLRHPDLLALAKAASCTPAQAVFKFAIIHGVVPLTGTTSELHMQEDLAVPDIDFGESATEHLASIRRIVLDQAA